MEPNYRCVTLVCLELAHTHTEAEVKMYGDKYIMKYKHVYRTLWQLSKCMGAGLDLRPLDPTR